MYALTPMPGTNWPAGDFPRQLRALREKAGLTQDQAAGLIGVKAQTVSNWEREWSVPHPATQEAVLAKLKRAGKRKRPPA